jgi:hypothetical protein
LYSTFGIKPPDSESNPKPEPEPEPAAEPEPNPDGQTAPGQEPNPQQTPPAEPDKPEENPPQEPDNSQTNKSAQAFAQMRIQNKQYLNLINGVAKALGVKDTSNPENVLASLNDLVTKAQAKKDGIPEEVYKRLQTLEAQNQEHTQEQAKQMAYLGFQKVKDTYKLDDKGLQNFADELVQAGINPFENPDVNLLNEYRTRHYDELMQAAIQQGIKQEMERAAKAQNHSSTPNNKNGQGVTDPEKITTVAQLNAWFDKQTPHK